MNLKKNCDSPPQAAMMQLPKVITAPEQLGREQNCPWLLYNKNSKLAYL